MANRKDNYMQALTNILFAVEEIYGLRDVVDGQPLLHCDTKYIVGYFNQKLSDMSNTKVSELNARAGKELILLSYLTCRLRYFGKKRLDYSKYPNMRKVTKVLKAFTRMKYVNQESLRGINIVISLLVEIDKKYINFRNALGYRYLRIFVILVMFGNYCNASVVADFILNQIITREDLK